MLFKILILLTCFNYIFCNQSARIFGGQQRVEPGEFPYNVLVHIRKTLENEIKSFCGSILAEKWVLVAAHSVFSDISNPNWFEVIAGKYNLLEWTGSEQVRRVKSVIQHPHYTDSVKGRHDLSLLLLNTPLNFNNLVQPVVLETNQDYPLGAVGMVTGYGVIQPTGTAASYLTKLSVNILTPGVCSSGDSSWNPTLVCSDPGTCENDSGAPLVIRNGGQWRQVGLVSFGFHCAFYGNPTYYTFLPQYLNWINETMVAEDSGTGSNRPTPLVGILIVTCSKLIVGLLKF